MMNDLEFSKATNLRNCIRILESLCGDVELVSYGLAPNPDGFCYEIHTQVSDTDLKVLDDALGMLTTNEENTLKELYL
jgi:hypothetical protein